MSTITELASNLVDMCRQGRFVDAVDKFYAPNIVSVESVDFGLGKEQRGLEAVRGKNVWWEENNELHGVQVAGPFVGAGRHSNQFAVRFDFDVTSNATGQRRRVVEMALYTVEDGRIVREEFYYPAA
ncbi:MAG TPA: nuclear transport factor 2 family protein [Gemmatimonadaceae bacterium]|nr:nuclear transport factor 2 family protein [Gemmatimonadaceae bacterium]